MSLPYTRFKTEETTAAALLAWLETHRYVYVKDGGHKTVRLSLTSKVKRWKRNPERFEFTVSRPDWKGRDERIKVTNDDLGEIRIPNAQWWHGITAHAYHTFDLESGYTSDATRGYLKRYGVWNGNKTVSARILKTNVCLHQSNGFVLNFDKLDHAINFAKRQNIRLTVGRGKRKRVLVNERPEIGG